MTRRLRYALAAILGPVVDRLCGITDDAQAHVDTWGRD